VIGNKSNSSEGLETFIEKNNKNGWKENWKDVNLEIGTDGYRTKIASVFE
jgi:hypothetical protein